jgi:hypothetical protein
MNDLINISVLMYDYYRFIYTSDPGSKMIEQENR